MDGFTTELDVLKDIANNYLATSVEDLRKARGHLIQCDSEADNAFSGDNTDLFSEVRKEYEKTSKALYDSMTRNWELLWDAVEAIEEIAKRYAALDGQ